MNTLQVAAESPWLVRAGAATLLTLHIAGGSVGMISGTMALTVRKGSRVHVLAGRTFFISMLVMASIGALVSPFLVTAQGNPKLFDSIAGSFTCYLVMTGWMTMRRKAGTIGRAEVAAFVFAALLAAAAILLGTRTAGGGTGYYVIGGIIALAAALDLKVILNRGIAGTPRMARHVWRMCLALFVAIGSFFLGQQRVMPESVQGSLWLDIPPLAVLAMMLFWLLKLRLAKVIGTLRQKRRLRRQAIPAAS
ncbi:MAG TPA: hypothetical protein VGO55_13240 [Allosphingosinicella sp.]|jgi:hypothetical protein|nr:hypothetical protein [Allosphingosinicella sp.]